MEMIHNHLHDSVMVGATEWKELGTTGLEVDGFNPEET